MTTTTRRTIIVGAAALPLLPGAALAASATLPASALAQPADPAVEAYRVWRVALDAYEGSFLPDMPDDDPDMIAAMRAECQANADLASIVATSPEGLAGQVRFAFYMFGEVRRGDDWHSPADYHPESFRRDDGKALLLSMLAGAESMAGGVS